MAIADRIKAGFRHSRPFEIPKLEPLLDKLPDDWHRAVTAPDFSNSDSKRLNFFPSSPSWGTSANRLLGVSGSHFLLTNAGRRYLMEQFCKDHHGFYK